MPEVLRTVSVTEPCLSEEKEDGLVIGAVDGDDNGLCVGSTVVVGNDDGE